MLIVSEQKSLPYMCMQGYDTYLSTNFEYVYSLYVIKTYYISIFVYRSNHLNIIAYYELTQQIGKTLAPIIFDELKQVKKYLSHKQCFYSILYF